MASDHMDNDVNRPREIPEWSNLEVHPLISLIVSRMESNPEDFYVYHYTTAGNKTALALSINTKSAEWNSIIENSKGLWNRKEKWLFNRALRAVRMNESHMRAMRKLLV